MGAPKATETPAAEAAERISLFFASLLPYLAKKRLMMLPMQQLQWTSGPSLPSERPAATVSIMPSDLMVSVQLPR